MDAVYLRYKGFEESNDLGLSSLGKSLIGVDDVFKECFKITKIQGDIETKVINAENGSIIIDIAIYILQTANSLPFENIQHFLDFLVLADYTKFLELTQYLSAHPFETYTNLETFFSAHPIAYDITKLVGGFLIGGFIIGKSVKNMQVNINIQHQGPITIGDKHVTYSQFNSIKGMITKGAFNNVFAPFVEDEVETLEIGIKDDDERTPSLTIDTGDFENYISSGQEILPHLIDGNSYNIQGRITAMQVSKGESMQFKTHLDDKTWYLRLKTTEGHIEDYRNYFNQDVLIEAVVKRTSLFKKPTIILSSIRFVNEPLFTIDNP